QIIAYDKKVEVDHYKRENYIKRVAKIDNVEIAGIGAATTAQKNELIAKIKNGSAYFIYNLAGESYINSLNSKVMMQKRAYEKNVRNSWVNDMTGIFNYSTVDNYLKDGYLDTSKGRTPQENIEDGIKKYSKIGYVPIGEILAIISAIISILMAVYQLIKEICNAFTGDTSKLSSGQAHNSDFQGFGASGGSGSGSKSGTGAGTWEDPLGIGISGGWLLGGLAAVVGFIFIIRQD
ncbi:MAG: hypothetical protein LBC68_13645, partial [Prevotellaceae bacterium]|nr:hypothetical protein [Prevotellaceae bacterium]